MSPAKSFDGISAQLELIDDIVCDAVNEYANHARVTPKMKRDLKQACKEIQHLIERIDG